MVQKRFGSAETTGRKLDVIGEYLSMYQKALSNRGLQTIYIDGFAGSGEVQNAEHQDGLFDEEVQTVIAGSANRALGTEPPFGKKNTAFGTTSPGTTITGWPKTWDRPSSPWAWKKGIVSPSSARIALNG